MVRRQKFVLDSLQLLCSVPFPLGVSCWLTPSPCFGLDTGFNPFITESGMKGMQRELQTFGGDTE